MKILDQIHPQQQVQVGLRLNFSMIWAGSPPVDLYLIFEKSNLKNQVVKIKL